MSRKKTEEPESATDAWSTPITPSQAWAEARDLLAADPVAQQTLLTQASVTAGRAELRRLRAIWALFGLTPPWEEVLGVIDQEPDENASQGGT